MDTWAAANYSQDEPLDFLRDPVKLSRTPVLTDKRYPGFHYHQTEFETSEKNPECFTSCRFTVLWGAFPRAKGRGDPRKRQTPPGWRGVVSTPANGT